jgi:hypothetical protein
MSSPDATANDVDVRQFDAKVGVLDVVKFEVKQGQSGVLARPGAGVKAQPKVALGHALLRDAAGQPRDVARVPVDTDRPPTFESPA